LQSVRTAVVGASGYSGQELLRYLARHPVFQIVTVAAKTSAGQKLSQLVSGLPRDLAQLQIRDLTPAQLAAEADLFFLAVPHGTAAPYAFALREAGKTVVDLSADFRTTDPAIYQEFYGHPHPAPQLLKEAVYGLPEIHRAQLKSAKLIAAPGCFPTSIIVPFAPMLRYVQPSSIVVTSLSGVSGAGRKLESRLLFGEITDNMYAYGQPLHRHVGEIEQELSRIAQDKVTITFVPHLVPLHRGMVTTIAAKHAQPITTDQAIDELRIAYANEPFVEVLPEDRMPEARQVANSNRIQVTARVDGRAQRLLLFSAIDNLGKGNASQAIQAANLACGLEETLGLLSRAAVSPRRPDSWQPAWPVASSRAGRRTSPWSSRRCRPRPRLRSPPIS
jgi:N-acetyl-gamma-glutamyl-phosphate reductase